MYYDNRNFFPGEHVGYIKYYVSNSISIWPRSHGPLIIPIGSCKGIYFLVKLRSKAACRYLNFPGRTSFQLFIRTHTLRSPLTSCFICTQLELFPGHNSKPFFCWFLLTLNEKLNSGPCEAHMMEPFAKAVNGN